MKNNWSIVFLVMCFFIQACEKDNGTGTGPDPGTDPGNNSVNVTSFSPEYVVWGQELTINGSGFSPVKEDNYVWIKGYGMCNSNINDSTGWKRAVVVSSTAGKLVIKAPFSTFNNDVPCSGEGGELRITVKDKPTYIHPQPVNFVPFPFPLFFCDNYSGGYYASSAIYTGDSVAMNFGGTVLGTMAGNFIDKVRLKVDNLNVPVKPQLVINGCGHFVMTFLLDIERFAEADCDPVNPTWGKAGQMRTFTTYFEGMPGTEWSKDFWVNNLPEAKVLDVSGPSSVSKTGGGNPFWAITGKNMYYQNARFVSAGCSSMAMLNLVSGEPGPFYESYELNFPLSSMYPNCWYTVILTDLCGNDKNIGNVLILP